MGILDRFKRKKEEVRIPEDIPTSLPEDLERFKVTPHEVPRTEFYDKPLSVPRAEDGDKVELILQKLDTIDTRLKLIEEKLRRY